MTFVKGLLDTETNMSKGIDHRRDLAFAAITFGVLFLICAWRCRAMFYNGWFRNFYAGNHISTLPPPPPPPPPRGLKNSGLKLLPTETYTAEGIRDAKDCAICLSEFADGDLTRALPQCGHLFHVICVDKWLKAHSSCPSCRQLVTVISNSSATAVTPISYMV